MFINKTLKKRNFRTIKKVSIVNFLNEDEYCFLTYSRGDEMDIKEKKKIKCMFTQQGSFTPQLLSWMRLSSTANNYTAERGLRLNEN